MKQTKNPAQKAQKQSAQREKKPKLKSPMKPHLMLSNNEGWERAEKLSMETLTEIFAQFREELVPEMGIKKNRK